MATKRKSKPGDQRKFNRGDRAIFMFSFHEHDGGGLRVKSTDQEAAQMIASWDWEFQKIVKPTKRAKSVVNDDGIEALMEQGRAVMVDDWGMSAVVVELPFEKLRALLARDGWRFVSGMFIEFEGNHNDTEIIAVLEKL
jgi:hypothetical protein